MMSIPLGEHRPTSEHLEARLIAVELFAENTKQDLLSIATGVPTLSVIAAPGLPCALLCS